MRDVLANESAPEAGSGHAVNRTVEPSTVSVEEAMEPARAHAIALVEDDEQLAELLVEGLANFGFSVSHYPSTRVALDGIRSHRPDVLLCDVLLPDGNGLDFLSLIREDKLLWDLPVIMLSACAERSDVRAAMLRGADDYLVKPVPFKELSDSITTRFTRLCRQQLRVSSSSTSASGTVLDTACPHVSAAAFRGRECGHHREGSAHSNGDEGKAFDVTLLEDAIADAFRRLGRHSDLLFALDDANVCLPAPALPALASHIAVMTSAVSMRGDPVWVGGQLVGSDYELCVWMSPRPFSMTAQGDSRTASMQQLPPEANHMFCEAHDRLVEFATAHGLHFWFHSGRGVGIRAYLVLEPRSRGEAGAAS